MSKQFKYKWKQGAKYAPLHEVCGQVIADMHGGDPRVYAAWIRAQPDPMEAHKKLRDRAIAWDLLIGIEP